MRNKISSLFLIGSLFFSENISKAQIVPTSGEIVLTEREKTEVIQESPSERVVPPIVQDTIYTTVIKDAKNVSEVISPLGLAGIIFNYPSNIEPLAEGNNILENYLIRLEAELNTDRYYYLYNSYESGDFPYSGSFWSALGKSLIDSSELIREIDKSLRAVKEKTSLKAQTKDFNFRISPYIRGIESEDDLGLEIEMKIHGIEGLLYTKILKDKSRIGTSLRFKDNILLSLENYKRQHEKTEKSEYVTIAYLTYNF